MASKLEIVCPVCKAEALLRREPVYEGFKKTGERLLCSACGHAFESEETVPFKDQREVSVFTDADRPRDAEVFEETERRRNCRYCRHYVVNPFTQWCSLHHREVEATDVCDRFDRKPEEEGDA